MKLIALATIAVTMVMGILSFPLKAKSLALVECSDAQTATRQLNCGRENVFHGQSSLHFLRKHREAGTLKSRTNLKRASKYVIRYGKKHIERANQRLLPPHYFGWLCIHRYEGAWNDPNGPYYGGLQMDYGFMKSYGAALLRAKGTADHWTPMEQMWVAERAYNSGRRYYPWPNTARYCGLI